MKKLIVLLSILSLSFTVIKQDRENAKFIGSWSGSEIDKQTKGMSKHWVQTRFKDGTFLMLFTAIENCEAESMVEKGKWWIKDGLFYELHKSSGKTDIYTYEILDDQHIKFKIKQTEIVAETADYEFIDTKIEEDEEKK
jgi:hypothetical protein